MIIYLNYFLIINIIFGWINIYAANYEEGIQNIISMSTESGKQLFWITSSFVWILLILIIDGKFYTNFAYPIYGITILLLLGVILFGKEVGGARSWYAIGNFSLQPSEFAKIGTLLGLSKFLSQINFDISQFRTQIKALTFIILPIMLIMLQPDAGSAIVFASLFLVLQYPQFQIYKLCLPKPLLFLLFVSALYFFHIEYLVKKNCSYLLHL